MPDAPSLGTPAWNNRRGFAVRHNITCEDLRRMALGENLPDKDIAHRLGLGKSTIQRRRAECGIERNRSIPTRRMQGMRKDIADIYELYVMRELDEYQISEMRKIDVRTVRKIILRRGLTLRPLRKRNAIKVSRETLYRLHVEEKKKVEEIAKMHGCSSAGIRTHLKKHGVPLQPQRDPFEGITSERLEHEYHNMGVRKMQKKYKVGHDKIYRKLDECGIPRQGRTEHDRSEEATIRRADWKWRGAEAWERMCGVLGTVCHVCGRPAEKKLTLSIHHMWYEHGDVPHDGMGLEKGEYHARLEEVVVRNPGRFRMLCQGCHGLAGRLENMMGRDADGIKRLMAVVGKMDVDRKASK